MRAAADLRIVHLLERPEHRPRVAEWIYREFWADKPGYDAAGFEARLREASDPGRMPISLLALHGDEPAGTVNLVACDSERRPHLTPWLAALIVMPEHRRGGIGSSLVRALLAEAERLAFREVFLGTDIPAFYEALGAVTHERFDDGISILRFDLGLPGVRS